MQRRPDCINLSAAQTKNCFPAQSGHKRRRVPQKAWGNTMKKVLLAGVSLAAISVIGGAYAGDALPLMGQPSCDPYKNYSCLDSYLGDDFFRRFVNYYRLEWGHDGPPVDPKAPPSRRDYWPPTPQTTPPMPFTEWPYGGTTPIGVTRPGSADSPLMAALGNT